MLRSKTKDITKIIVEAGKKARRETNSAPEPEFTKPSSWPIDCTVGPGLEGAIACQSKVGYVNGSKGWLIYRGYDIFDLCAHSTFEETSYLLVHGSLPTEKQLSAFKKKLIEYRNIPNTVRFLLSFPVEQMNAMAALRMGTNLMRQELTYVDQDDYKPDAPNINADEDSIPMETKPEGKARAIYEFKKQAEREKGKGIDENMSLPVGREAAYHLLSGVSTIAGVISRVRCGVLPIPPDPKLGFAANLLYMITGRKPTPVEERIMDVALILHADHGMNASTFASMVVASTLSDIYLAIGSGIAALSGPLHGGANEEVLKMLKEIGGPRKVGAWYAKSMSKKKKVMGFGHRVYKAYDPRARVLGPLAEYLVKTLKDEKKEALFNTAKRLEKEVVSTLGVKKKIFPNVDFYSGIVYSCLDIPVELFTPIFAVSRVSGWTARVSEYLENNRIFRPRAIYTGQFDKKYVSIKKR